MITRLGSFREILIKNIQIFIFWLNLTPTLSEINYIIIYKPFALFLTLLDD